ncbi:DUF6809 family protein [Paenibacillus pinihumi]|uniref:DUF6809 family protein n=1 Tax=Paenibacillus pinihumi TaxID=669462 RepID=UPI00040C0362|nr:DUF6809 family protein [Paenibacillus pinihumi]
MKRILEELYEGKIHPEESVIPQTPHYKAVNQQVSEKLLAWKKKLSAEEYRELEELLDLRRESDTLQSKESFIFGFKLGALVMLDVLQGG